MERAHNVATCEVIDFLRDRGLCVRMCVYMYVLYHCLDAE